MHAHTCGVTWHRPQHIAHARPNLSLKHRWRKNPQTQSKTPKLPPKGKAARAAAAAPQCGARRGCQSRACCTPHQHPSARQPGCTLRGAGRPPAMIRGRHSWHVPSLALLLSHAAGPSRSTALSSLVHAVSEGKRHLLHLPLRRRPRRRRRLPRARCRAVVRAAACPPGVLRVLRRAVHALLRLAPPHLLQVRPRLHLQPKPAAGAKRGALG